MKAYRKRAKGSWNVGKGAKGDGEERQFSKLEIREAIATDEEAYLEKYRKGKRNRNEKARLEYRVQYYEALVRGWEARGTSERMMTYFRNELSEAKKGLSEFTKKFPEEKDHEGS